MARMIGPGYRVGTVHVGWVDPFDEFTVFEIAFGDHTAFVYWEQSYGEWRFEITKDDRALYDVSLFQDAGGDRYKRALDEGTTELMSWMLTEALA